MSTNPTSTAPTVTLNNGVEMPVLGFGVYQTPPEETAQHVRDALEVGYRLVDTAQAYGNEEGVGQAVRESGVAREDVFLTSKVWVANMNHDRAAASIEEGSSIRYTLLDSLPSIRQPFSEVSLADDDDGATEVTWTIELEAGHLTPVAARLADLLYGTIVRAASRELALP